MRIRKNLLISVVIVLLTVFLLPYSYSDGFRFNFGYPFSYFTTYNLSEPLKGNEILLSRTNTNPLIFLLDIGLIYLLLNFVSFLIKKLKNTENLNS